MEKVLTNIKTYNGNAKIFFATENEVIGCVAVYYSVDDLDVDENVEYNMGFIKNQILDKFNELKEDNQELDMYKFNWELDKIAIQISPYVK